MSQLVLSKGTNFKSSILRRLNLNFELGSYFLVVSLIIFVALTVVITLMFSARQVTKGYVLNSLESQHQELVKESEIREMEISKVRSLNHIQQSSKVRQMVRPPQVVFVNSESTIASK